MLRAASELGWTRMDLPFLLGTAVTADRVRAKAAGYALHFVFGLVFALAYYAVFAVIGQLGIRARRAPRPRPRARSPAPRSSTSCSPSSTRAWARASTPPDRRPLLEPPGFMLRNYGRQTPLATIVSHVAYGAIVGGLRLLGWLSWRTATRA